MADAVTGTRGTTGVEGVVDASNSMPVDFRVRTLAEEEAAEDAVEGDPSGRRPTWMPDR